ncbi:MAG: histidine phosphatase family protein [Patescibacteria group bacterium]
MIITFIRHSKSLVNPAIPITTWGLSEEGVMLAKKLQSLEQIKSLDVIYASLQPKALETAILATKNMGIPIKTDNRLTETTSFTNRFVNLSQLQENTKKYFASKHVSINQGETAEEAFTRFNEALHEIVATDKERSNIGIVSHGNILADFAARYLSIDSYELVEKIRQPDVAVFDWRKKEFIHNFGEFTHKD